MQGRRFARTDLGRADQLYFLPMKLSVVMPCYNEKATIREIVGRVQGVDLGGVELEIVIVDDGSKDGTRDILATIPELDDDEADSGPHTPSVEDSHPTQVVRIK